MSRKVKLNNKIDKVYNKLTHIRNRVFYLKGQKATEEVIKEFEVLDRKRIILECNLNLLKKFLREHMTVEIGNYAIIIKEKEVLHYQVKSFNVSSFGRKTYRNITTYKCIKELSQFIGNKLDNDSLDIESKIRRFYNDR